MNCIVRFFELPLWCAWFGTSPDRAADRPVVHGAEAGLRVIHGVVGR
ncbi:hypothetical protein ABT224_21895 [Streptomyces sp. NPDC001584]